MCETLQRSGTVRANRKLTDTLFVLDIESPDVAASIQPGQFIHVKIPGMDDHILRRPFSVYQVDTDAGIMSVLYQCVGYGTDHLSRLEAPFTIDIIGPVGNRWEIPEGQRILLVAGGVGAAPLFSSPSSLFLLVRKLMWCWERKRRNALVAREAYMAVLGREPYAQLMMAPMAITVSAPGVVSELLQTKPYDLVACCGPEPMMKSLCDITSAKNIPTAISLEKRMACGIGACLSCVVATTEGFKRSCVDGPIFDAAKVVW